MSLGIHKVERLWENFHPAIIGTASTLLCLTKGKEITTFLEDNGAKFDQLYSSVFNVASIFTAFLFTFYTFIATADRGFLSAAKKTSYYKRSVKFTVEALIWGSLLCLATIPMLMMQPKPSQHTAHLVFFSIWFGISAVSISQFVRATNLFIILANRQNA